VPEQEWPAIGWCNISLTGRQTFKGYTHDEYKRMEKAYMDPIRKYFTENSIPDGIVSQCMRLHNEGTEIMEGYEDANYEGFVAALDVLADIHKSKGEDIDLSLKLVKKQPVMA
jgi:hypothetical protein